MAAFPQYASAKGEDRSRYRLPGSSSLARSRRSIRAFPYVGPPRPHVAVLRGRARPIRRSEGGSAQQPSQSIRAFTYVVRPYTNARIALTTKTGRFVFANKAMQRSLNPSHRDIAGCTWFDVLRCSLAKARIQCAAQAVETTRPVVLIGMIGGLCICSVFQVLRSATLEGGEVLVSCHRLSAIDRVSDFWTDTGHEIVLAEYNDLGALSILTERELEILVLIGEGLSGPRIGRHL